MPAISCPSVETSGKTAVSKCRSEPQIPVAATLTRTPSPCGRSTSTRCTCPCSQRTARMIFPHDKQTLCSPYLSRIAAPRQLLLGRRVGGGLAFRLGLFRAKEEQVAQEARG